MSISYEDSIANINIPGKQSICLRLKEYVPVAWKVENLLEMMDYSESDRQHKLYDALLIIDGQCCEGDYMVTTDMDETHDFQAFKECIQHHDHEAGQWTEKDYETIWAMVKPLVRKEVTTWG